MNITEKGFGEEGGAGVPCIAHVYLMKKSCPALESESKLDGMHPALEPSNRIKKGEGK